MRRRRRGGLAENGARSGEGGRARGDALVEELVEEGGQLAVLDEEAVVTVIAERSLGLSDLVTIARFPGKHDLVLSDAPVREAVYATMRGWLDAFVH